MKITLVCWCGVTHQKKAGAVNRSRRIGAPIYCTRACAGLARRCGKTIAQQKAEKQAYDLAYRSERLGVLKAQKAEYFQRTYDKEAARVKRKERAEWQREYGRSYRRNPAWIAHKIEYDRKLRASEYGPFAEAYAILLELQRTIRVMVPDKYERMKARGYYDTFRHPQQRSMR